MTDRTDDDVIDPAPSADDTPSERTGAPAPGQSPAPRDGDPGDRSDDRDVVAPRDEALQYGVGPFSVREVALLGVWAVAFLVSFFPLNTVFGDARVLVGGSNVWLSGLWWIPAIAVPTVAVGLIVLRRLSPQGIRRVGSLGIDQFASVAFSVAALVWVAWVWDTVAVALEIAVWPRSWVVWVEAVLMVAGVVLTVLAPFIPPFEQDFQGRGDAPAHRNARPIRAVVPRPKTPRPPRPSAQPAPVEPSETPGDEGPAVTFDHAAPAPSTTVLPTAGEPDTHDTDVFAPLHTDTDAHRTVDPTDDASTPAATQAFWALAPVEREVVDDYGTPIFRIGPTAWALVIEDRGETYVIRHDDGRIGYLHDVSGVTRG